MYDDLIKAQKEIEAVGKDGKNPFFHSDYTTLNATILACKEVLNKYNFAVLQPMQSDEHGVYVCTTLIHTSGEMIQSRMKIETIKQKITKSYKDKDGKDIVEVSGGNPQAQGSAITYARRYSLKSMLCMSDADDDGEKAMSRPTSSPAKSYAQNKPLVGTATEKQIDAVLKLAKKTGREISLDETNNMTKQRASELIDTMMKELG